jgi:hypothetical protein
MKKEKIHLLTIMAGLLLAIAIVFSQVFQSQLTTHLKHDVKKTEQKKTDNQEEQLYSAAPSFSLPSSVQLHLNVEAYCLFEIVCSEEQHQSDSHESPLRPQKLFQTLFRVIIAPNAP